ncbi:MAG: hypothetical protein GY804_00130 [Alphaproteobacteria bacterium]|nr:hypothetical protein [Alphaproteobacteria bacterium]
MKTGKKKIEIQFQGSVVAEKQKWIKGTLSVQGGYIMLHSPFISAQWPVDDTGPELNKFPDGRLKLGFHHTGCNSQIYQSFYLNGKHFKEIEAFFHGWGFPVPRAKVLTKSQFDKAH